jgi:hypothetical protein
MTVAPEVIRIKTGCSEEEDAGRVSHSNNQEFTSKQRQEGIMYNNYMTR